MDTATASPTLRQARDQYLAWLRDARDLSDHTVRAYGSDVMALLQSLDEQPLVADLDPALIRCFFDLQRKRGIRSASLRRRAAAIRSFCLFLHRQHLVPANPWPREGFTFQRTRSLPRALAADDLTRLLGYVMDQASLGSRFPDDQPLPNPEAATTLLGTTLMLATGLRVGELVSFRQSDIDLSNRTIHVLGKGRRERIVYLTDDWLTRLTRAYSVTRDHLGIYHREFLFSSTHAPLTTASVRARLAKAGRAAGLRHHVTPHMLRHSAATQLIESGVNIRFVQRLLGHASLTTTEIYTHVTDRALQDAVIEAGVLFRSRGRR